MSGDREVVHVAWGPSRADSVRDALRMQGNGQRVIALSGALNLGPIASPDPGARHAWARANLRDEDLDRNWHEPEAPWLEATSPGVHPIFWVCLTDAAEHASFLAFADRRAGRPFDIVDATGIDVSAVGGHSPIVSLGQLRPAEIVASDLHGKRRPVSRAEGEAASATWARLRRENAPLRVVRDGRLVSAPLTHFDHVLARQARANWELSIELIARMFDHLTFEVDPPGPSVGDAFLFARVLALGEAGILDLRGTGPGMRDYEVRRPAAASPS